MDGSITVRRTRQRYVLRRLVYRWWCTPCKRGGYHRSDRLKDRVLEHMGKPPDKHPWVRAMEGAIRHHHEFHSACPACGAGEHRPAGRS